ncbi:MAG: zinc-binding dehydrogenase [Gemmiger sp.]
MKAVIVTDDHKAEVLEIEKPVVGKDEVMVKVDMCMLCTWDQRVYTRKMPLPLPFLGGHEFAGTIVEVGEGVDPKQFPIGAKAVGNAVSHCGTCENCRSGEHRNCFYADTTHQKGLAEYIVLNKQHIFVADADISFEDLAFAEPLACVLTGFEKFDLNFGDTVAILGGGVMGQMAIALAKNRGARIILSDPVAYRREDALKNGADVVIDPSKVDCVQEVKKLTGGYGVNVVFNTVAIPNAITQGLSMLNMGGTFLMYGKVFPNEPVPVDINLIHDFELKLTGTISALDHSFQRAVKLLTSKRIRPQEMGLLSEVYAKEDCTKAFERSMETTTYRVGIKF